MQYARNIRQYQTIAVQSVTPERMIVMLYEGIQRFLDRARQALSEGDIAERALQLSKAQAVLSELDNALDHDAGAGFTRDLSALYLYCRHELNELTIDRDVRHLDHVETTLRPLLEAWRKVPLLADRPEERRAPAMDALPAEDIGNLGTERAASEHGGQEDAAPDSADACKSNLCVAV